MNHSKEYWSLVSTVFPNYKEKRNYLKENSLKLNIPISVVMWDYSNNKMSLDDAMLYMKETANFICKKGHSFSKINNLCHINIFSFILS